MNKINILNKLNKIASTLEDNELYNYSNSITNVMKKIAYPENFESDEQIIEQLINYLKNTTLNTENVDLRSMVRDSIEELKSRINRLSSDVNLLDNENI